MHLTITLTAGQRVEYNDDGDFFRLMSATAPVSVEFFKQGREIAEAAAVGAGYAEKFINQTFDRFIIASATAQTIQIATRLGNEVYYDTPPVGAVSITNTALQFWQNTETVTNASGQLLVSRSQRKYLLIQNKNPTGTIYVNLQGLTATVANGVEIPPGGSLEIQNFCPSTIITAIGDIASNPNVITVDA